MKKVLVTDDVHPLLIEGLEQEGFKCDYRPKISLEEVNKRVENYEGLIVNSKILVDKMMLDRAKKLLFVGRLGSGMEIIDQNYAREKGVDVFSAPEGNCNAVGEHALGMLLALANKLVWGDIEVRFDIWEREKNRGFEIMGLKIGIIGFGHTGRAFARKLKGMDMSILAYDKYKKNYTTDFPHVKESSPDEICSEADIISFHLPLTDETHHLVDRSYINKCKPGVIFINTSRGNVIETKVLIEALESEQVNGACLDVFENEKPATYTTEEKRDFDKLHKFKNVILSPHVAGWTIESKRRLAEVLLRKIKTIV